MTEHTDMLIARLRELLDSADDALDKDTYDQVRALGHDGADDTEMVITAATRRKINKLFEALDQGIERLASALEVRKQAP